MESPNESNGQVVVAAESDNQIVVTGDNKIKGLEILEKNITRVPVTDNQLHRLYDAFTADGSTSVSVETLIDFYNSLDHIGVPRTEREVRWVVTECAQTTPGSLTYPEFACFMLKISQW